MKLLLDQNLSYRLVPDLLGGFPGSRHVRDEGLSHADDSQIWEFAKQQDFAIVSKDTDFFNRSLLRGHPPKGHSTTTRQLLNASYSSSAPQKSGRDQRVPREPSGICPGY
jgi:predicted nuclease of predicted toxin-antitoxin system